MEKIKIELTNEEYDMLLELQDVLGHKTLDETINTILKQFIKEEEHKIRKAEEINKEHSKKHAEFIRETAGRKKAFNEMRGKRKKI